MSGNGPPPRAREAVHSRPARAPFAWLALAGIVVLAAVAGGLGWWQAARDAASPMDTKDVRVIARGAVVYERYCASCHGAALQGQPDWRARSPDGRLPAPPHDASGHTWHHPPDVLFSIVERGLEAFAPPGYRSDMPAFGGLLPDDDIWAVLAYIKSTWPDDVRERHDAFTRGAGRR